MVIRPLAKGDIDQVAAVLAEAFSNDPVMSWLVVDPATRTGRLKRMFAANVRYTYLPEGGSEVACTDSGEIVGAALWAPPGHWRPSRWATLRCMPSLLNAVRSRAAVGQTLDEALVAHHPSELHWYLSIVGSGSAGRGKGYATRLISARLERCDAAGLPAYLESSKVANVPYYERFGFRKTGEISVPDGPTLYPMWRAPGGAV